MRNAINKMIQLGLYGAMVASCAQLKASRTMPGTVSDGAFQAVRPGSKSVGADATFSCPSSGFMQLLKNDARPRADGVAATEDGQLCAVAEALSGWTSDNAIPTSVLDYVSWTYGLPSPPRVQIVNSNFNTEVVADIVEHFKEPLTRFTQNATRPRFGGALMRVAKDKSRAILVMHDSLVELTPVPRELPLNGSVHIKGRSAKAGSTAAVVVSDTTGKLDKSAKPAAEFDVEAKCGAQPGRMLVEIQNKDDRDQTQRIGFPIYCGQPAPLKAVLPVEQNATNAKALLDTINAERTAAGLSAIQWDDTVAKVAGTAAEALRDEVAKGGPATVADPTPWLKKAGVGAGVVLENPGQALSPGDAHHEFSINPALRENYMSPGVTSMGVGVAPAAAKGAGTYVVELFIQKLQKIDTAKAAQELAAKISEKRSSAKLAPLSTDAMLEKAANQYASALAASKGTLTDAQANGFVSPLYKSFASLNVMAGARTEALGIAEEQSILGKGSLMGIGVAQGDNDKLGTNAVYVVVLMGTKRGK